MESSREFLYLKLADARANKEHAMNAGWGPGRKPCSLLEYFYDQLYVLSHYREMQYKGQLKSTSNES